MSHALRRAFLAGFEGGQYVTEVVKQTYLVIDEGAEEEELWRKFKRENEDLFPAETNDRVKPCGCVVCVCEDEKQCQGCGAKMCVAHQSKKNQTDLINRTQKLTGSIDDLFIFLELSLYLDRDLKALCHFVFQTKDSTTWCRPINWEGLYSCLREGGLVFYSPEWVEVFNRDGGINSWPTPLRSRPKDREMFMTFGPREPIRPEIVIPQSVISTGLFHDSRIARDLHEEGLTVLSKVGQ